MTFEEVKISEFESLINKLSKGLCWTKENQKKRIKLVDGKVAFKNK